LKRDGHGVRVEGNGKVGVPNGRESISKEWTMEGTIASDFGDYKKNT
jgi:hypothetical protein